MSQCAACSQFTPSALHGGTVRRIGAVMTGVATLPRLAGMPVPANGAERDLQCRKVPQPIARPGANMARGRQPPEYLAKQLGVCS